MKYETKTLPSGIVIENRPDIRTKYLWYIKDTFTTHNEGEPAIIYNNGDKAYYQYNQYHRLDGPAIEYADGIKSYYIDGGFRLQEKDYWKHPKVITYKYLKEHPELEGFV